MFVARTLVVVVVVVARTSLRSWPTELISVDLACQRALLAASHEIRQNQKLSPETLGWGLGVVKTGTVSLDLGSDLGWVGLGLFEEL